MKSISTEWFTDMFLTYAEDANRAMPGLVKIDRESKTFTIDYAAHDAVYLDLNAEQESQFTRILEGAEMLPHDWEVSILNA